MPPNGKAAGGSASSAEKEIDIDPLTVYFTFSRIRPRFSCGRTIASTLQQFRDGELQPRDLPLLSVLTDGTHYYSQNNRRLYTYKQLRQEGLLETVPVRLRPLPQTKRMHSKYTPESCALTATLMRDTANKDTSEKPTAAAAAHDRAGSDDDDDGDDSDVSLAGSATADPSHCTPPPLGEPRDENSRGAAPEAEANARHRGEEGNSDPARSGASRALPAAQRGQQPPPSCRKPTARRQGRRKGAATRRVSSSSSSDDGDGRGGASDLEAELRKLGLGA